MSRSLSVRGRICASATILAALMLVAISALIVWLVENDVRQDAESALAAALQQQASDLGDGGTASPFPVGGDTSFDLVVDGSLYELGLFNELSAGNASGLLSIDGDVVAVLEIDLRSQRIVDVFEPGGTTSLSNRELRQQLSELTFQMLDLDGDAGDAVLVGAVAADLSAATGAVRRALMITVPILIVAVALASWWLAGRALRPVAAMTNEVRDISTSNLEQRVPVPAGSDEVAELAAVMNQMLHRLEAGDRAQRQFSADASHELRTPLTTIRIAAESLSRRVRGEDAELAEHIVAESDRMESLISDLLALARSESGTDAFAPVDLAEVVRDIGELSNATTVDVDGSVYVSGDAAQLERLLRNLVDNAHRHGLGTARVSLDSTAGFVTLTVDDDGPGIPVAEREAIFERFRRSDSDRGRLTGGSGLGLALVKTIAERHGGTVRAGASPTHEGARFTVTLPSR